MRRLLHISLMFLLILSSCGVGAISWNECNKVEADVFPRKIIITRHIDLQGHTFEVPANTILEFQGGSIRNGIIKGNNTKLENLQPYCMLCSFEGSFEDLDVNVDVFGLHPHGDGTVKRTNNQQAAFYRLNTLLPCVENITLHFEPGYYGFGGGGDTPQGKGQSSRLWFGHFAFYLYDFANVSRLKYFEIDGKGAIFLNVFPYYVGAWTKNSKGRMELYKEWDNADGEVENSRHATEAGGFVYIRTDDPVNLNFHDFTVDMNRDIFRYGGYQFWTQTQCGLALTTNGDITIDHITSKNNVTDGVMILCQKYSGREVFAKNVVIRNSTFQNNVRLGLSLSVGQNNVVDNCDFISNGRIELMNDSYRFESPFADIDIEPIIDRPFADVEIKNCRFKETNFFSIVSSRQNIRSIVVSDCSAANTLPQWTYGKIKDRKGNEVFGIVESTVEPIFFNGHAVEVLSLERIDLTDVGLGVGCILYAPRAEDRGKEGQYYVTSAPKKRASVKSVHIHSGSTFTGEVLSRRANKKDQVVNLLYLSSSLHNYQYTSGRWNFVEVTPTQYGFGGWDIEDVVYDVKDGYGVKGAAGWDKGIITISNLTLNILEKRTAMPVFNYMFRDGSNGGVSENSGVKVKNLVINDKDNGFSKVVKEPPFSNKVFLSITQ